MCDSTTQHESSRSMHVCYLCVCVCVGVCVYYKPILSFHFSLITAHISGTYTHSPIHRHMCIKCIKWRKSVCRLKPELHWCFFISRGCFKYRAENPEISVYISHLFQHIKSVQARELRFQIKHLIRTLLRCVVFKMVEQRHSLTHIRN